MKRDIQSKEDVEKLMAAFYGKATKDEIIGQKFDGIDMSKHIPRIVDFWRTIIFYDGNFKGSPFDKHIPLHLKNKDFERWLFLFEETMNEYFEGEKATEMINRAKLIGKTFEYKINTLQ